MIVRRKRTNLDLVDDVGRKYSPDILWDRYGQYLIDRFGVRRRYYDRLLQFLHTVPFRWSIPMDINRAKGGMDLRRDFGDPFQDRECSVLEMLIAFAYRIDCEYTGEPGEPTAEPLFWVFLENLGLDEFTDHFFDEVEIDGILQTWMHRDFKFDGRGSICPLKRPDQDQRNVEIWNQMMSYITENYS